MDTRLPRISTASEFDLEITINNHELSRECIKVLKHVNLKCTVFHWPGAVEFIFRVTPRDCQTTLEFWETIILPTAKQLYNARNKSRSAGQHNPKNTKIARTKKR